MSASVDRVFEIVIDAEADRVWRALTSPDYTSEWWFANTVESSWQVGSPVTYVGEDGVPDIVGEVLAFDPPRHLETTFRPVWSQAAGGHPETRIDWRLQPVDGIADGEQTRVVLTHFDVPEGSALDHETTPGWSYLLESLKTLVEAENPSR
jgi:uncharacterized protein YndB with AHSA1/START domain